MALSHSFHVGTFLLFLAFACLLVATISAPVVNSIALLKANTAGGRLNFGALGYCILNNGPDTCTSSHVGYRVSDLVSEGNNVWYNVGLDNLTRGLVLHPIACGIAGLAFLIAAFSHRIGFLVATLVCFIAFVVTLVTMAIDLAIFLPVRHHIRDAGGSASLGSATWLTIAALILLFFATFATCFACFTDRRSRRTSRV